jgi:DNA-binding response OmpR family regulator
MAERPGGERRTDGRVLVVDDEPSIRLLCRVNLPFAGFDVVEAADGEAALARLEDEEVDLVLADVMMPGMSGLEFVEQLRARDRTADVPVVFLSARADDVDVERGLAAGAAAYITKPFDPLELGPRLRAILDAA